MGSVILRDFDGNILSNFWQYGLIEWAVFYMCLETVVASAGNEAWAIFQYDEARPGKKGAHCPPNNDCPSPGTYILLSSDGSPISVTFVPEEARPRHPATSNIPTYISQPSAHIFPRTYEIEWLSKGYHNLITDPAPLNEVGGTTKIDSIQNVILLRSDLRAAWDNYDFGVNPDRGYVIIPFVEGYEDIAGNVLKLDHISDQNLRPLDELFRDHFRQGVLKNMKGAGETLWDYENVIGGGSMDLLSEISVGKQHLDATQTTQPSSHTRGWLLAEPPFAGVV